MVVKLLDTGSKAEKPKRKARSKPVENTGHG